MNSLKIKLKRLPVLFIVVCLVALPGCGESYKAQIDKQIPLAQQALDNLASSLNANTVRNGLILKNYADLLKKQKPELTELVEQLAKDATAEGPMYQGLLKRFNSVKQPNDLITDEERLLELLTITQAADPVVFSDALSDVVNVLADLSEGKLARVNAVSKQSELSANSAKDFGAGSQLIGNPSYGQWRTGRDGVSFWEWYGMYAMFSALTGPRYYYHDWAPNRNYSYYHDYGRSTYTSPSRYKKQESIYKNTKQRFNSTGKRFNSPYAQTKTGSSSLSSKSRSNLSRGNSKSSYQSSYRNSSSRTSRGLSYGK